MQKQESLAARRPRTQACVIAPTGHLPFAPAVGTIYRGDVTYAPTRNFKLVFEQDGNLVLYGIDVLDPPLDISTASYSNVVWESATGGAGGSHVSGLTPSIGLSIEFAIGAEGAGAVEFVQAATFVVASGGNQIAAKSIMLAEISGFKQSDLAG